MSFLFGGLLAVGSLVPLGWFVLFTWLISLSYYWSVCLSILGLFSFATAMVVGFYVGLVCLVMLLFLLFCCVCFVGLICCCSVI